MTQSNSPHITLVLGGARSGKSRYAEQLAIASSLPVTYIATALVFDDEFGKRVAHHQSRRPKDWSTVEQAHDLALALQNHAKAGQCVIVDCLTLWLAQCICPDCAQPETLDWQSEKAGLLEMLPRLAGKVILVSNEVGIGIVPLGAINRQFQDEQGRLNQAVAQLANEVVFIAAGLPIKLKG
ncbi:MAG: bifunctional adenosylcobinamide kinase/adenosylcobinamide-phosphate guanylyltransferase [Proteobacteria bacterium ST_bin12]|nr:MAG: bifunctional adenosylcobinamide kinase/adenosylcobinamide-phosphate guanylyltransferase [Proteobacteria bacterium ST_bin12]